MAGSTKALPRQPSPVMFRPTPELGAMVTAFAAARAVGINEAYKNLAALAAVGLDVRHYDLLTQMAALMTGRNAFVREALHVNAALLAAGRVDPRYAFDPDRTRFLITTVTDQVRGAGQAIRPEVVESLLVRLGFLKSPASAKASAFQQHGDATVDAEAQSEPQKIPIRITE